MNIFNSLGSNYDLSTAMRILFAVGSAGAKRRLIKGLESRYGGKAILTYKGREALLLALRALPEKGAVVMNGFTCLAVYEAIVASGHEVCYVDVPAHELEFSPESLREVLATRNDIKAVIVQNTLGIPCDMRQIHALCREHGVVLIEDLAHSIGARYASGEETGTIGDFVVLSFGQDKVVDAVAGGVLIVRASSFASAVRKPEQHVSLVRQLKDRLYPLLSISVRAAYKLGFGPIYHACIRSLRLLSTPLGEPSEKVRSLPGWYCSNILRQMDYLPAIAKHREEIAKIYAVHLEGSLLPHRVFRHIPHSSNVRFPIFIQGRNRLCAHMKTHGIRIADTWYDAPVAPKKYLRRTNYRSGTCPHAEHLAERIVNLPTHVNVSQDDARAIASLINEWARADLALPYHVRAANESAWEDFIRRQKPHSFLHSWKWGLLQEETGSRVFRLGAYKGGNLVAIALLIRTQARRGTFLLCPHGPLMAAGEDSAPIFNLLVEECTRLGRAEGCDFLRFCPLAEDSERDRALYRNAGFRDAPIHMHPELAWMLDITRSEDELLREMRKTTRYLVRKMEKDGVEIARSNDPADIEKFWPIYEATAARQHFTTFKKSDLRKEFELYAKDDQALFFFGSQRGSLVAAAIIIFYGGQAFYHHSGSASYDAGGANVSYLLQWRVIQEAKRRGCTLYNLWGIAPDDRPDHPWAGLSLFKKGFGGFAERYVHAQDKPLSAKYGLNYLVETARRIKRGF